METHFFWSKVLGLILAVGMVLGYNSILKSRSQSEAISQLEFTLAQQTNSVEADSTPTETEATEAEELSPYTDGVYEGTAQGYGGEITVSVTITDGIIADLEVCSADHEDAAYLDAAMGIVDEILAAQSTEVDTISGATYSSTGIRTATENALREAEKA